MGQWICDVIKQHAGVQVVILNGGGVRAGLLKGDITYGDVYDVEPFGNTVVTLKLTGKDLKAAVEHGISNPKTSDGQFNGLKVKYNPKAPFGQRIISITLDDGTPIKAKQYYTVAINNFMLTGGDGYDFANAKDVIDANIPIRDMLLDKIKTTKVITPRAVAGIKAV